MLFFCHNKPFNLALAIVAMGAVAVTAQAEYPVCEGSPASGAGTIEFGGLKEYDGRWLGDGALFLGHSEQATLIDCAAACSKTQDCIAVGFQSKGFEGKPNCDFYNMNPTMIEEEDGTGEKGWMGVAIKGGCQGMRKCCTIHVS